jgi:hypothetical protein
MNRTRTFAALVILVATFAASASAQSVTAKKNVISANPFGLLLGLTNGEYERVISEQTTAGIGGSSYNIEKGDYVNADVFWRYYPSGNPLDGWAFGVKAGVTHLVDAGTRFGYGFDANRSWILGRDNNFYVGVGFGLKRLLGGSDADFDLKYVPTIRLVNIGYAF